MKEERWKKFHQKLRKSSPKGSFSTFNSFSWSLMWTEANEDLGFVNHIKGTFVGLFLSICNLKLVYFALSYLLTSFKFGLQLKILSDTVCKSPYGSLLLLLPSTNFFRVHHKISNIRPFTDSPPTPQPKTVFACKFVTGIRIGLARGGLPASLTLDRRWT